MMVRFLFASMVFSLTACGMSDDGRSQENAAVSTSSGADLESAAIDAGIIPSGQSINLAGVYERRSELGIDKFCATIVDDVEYRIGMLAVFGADSKCEAKGRATRIEETLNISLDGDEQCTFTARFDGVEIELPGALPESCREHCTPRASFSGVSFTKTADDIEAGLVTKGRDFEKLCE